jgi:hypothetical protein
MRAVETARKERQETGSGEVPEWSKGADCKSAGEAFGGSNPPLSTILSDLTIYNHQDLYENPVLF